MLLFDVVINTKQRTIDKPNPNRVVAMHQRNPILLCSRRTVVNLHLNTYVCFIGIRDQPIMVGIAVM